MEADEILKNLLFIANSTFCIINSNLIVVLVTMMAICLYFHFLLYSISSQVPFLLIQVQDYLFIELIDEERIFQACYLPILLLLSSITSELTWFIKLYLTLQPEKMIQRPCPTAQNNLPPLLLSFPCSLILILFAPSLYLFASKTFP